MFCFVLFVVMKIHVVIVHLVSKAQKKIVSKLPYA